MEDDDPLLPLGKRERLRREREAIQEALDSYSPPHVVRLWEVDPKRAEQHKRILSLVLSPYLPEFSDLNPTGPHDSSPSRQSFKDFYIPSKDGATDFRRFAKERLHLGYHRFHAFGEGVDEPESAQPDEICWIMEYTEGECHVIRRRIALAMGLFPAVTYKDTPFYDDEIAFRYDRRLFCRCRRREKHCIRPSHIELFASTGHLIP